VSEKKPPTKTSELAAELNRLLEPEIPAGYSFAGVLHDPSGHMMLIGSLPKHLAAELFANVARNVRS